MLSYFTTVVALLAAAEAYPGTKFRLNQKTKWALGQAVSTSSGQVSGHEADTAEGVSEYLGIPYAKAAEGNLRFAGPEEYVGDGVISGDSYVSIFHRLVCALRRDSGLVGAHSEPEQVFVSSVAMSHSQSAADEMDMILCSLSIRRLRMMNAQTKHLS